MIAYILAALLSFSTGRQVEVGLASVYGFGERWHGPTMANGRLLVEYPDTVATRNFPFGARVRVCALAKKPRCVSAINRDRGPFGTIRKDGQPGWMVAPKGPDGKRQPLPGWKFRGVIDLYWPVARRLGIRGLTPVLVMER